mgnify:CR=1 FL=1
MAFKFRFGDKVVPRHDLPALIETQEQVEFLNEVGTVEAYQLGGYMYISLSEPPRRVLVNERFYELWNPRKN